MAGHRGGWRLWALLAAALVVHCVVIASEDTRIWFPPPDVPASSSYTILVIPRGVNLDTTPPERFLLEVFDEEYGWKTFVSHRAIATVGGADVPPRQNDPVFFRFTDFEFDLSFTGYTAWDQPAGSDFTYPVSPEWRDVFSIRHNLLSSCDETWTYGGGIFNYYYVADTLDAPSCYLKEFQAGSRLHCTATLEFLADNSLFPRSDWVRQFDYIPAGVSFFFRDPSLTSCSEGPGQACGTIPEGGVRYTFSIDGYTTPHFVTTMTPCRETRIDLLISPSSLSALGPSDVLPSGFPFPAPDQFITWAVEDMLMAKGDPVGFLYRSVEARAWAAV